MAWDETASWVAGDENDQIYGRQLQRAAEAPQRDAGRRKVLRPEDVPWEMSRQGLRFPHQHAAALPHRDVEPRRATRAGPVPAAAMSAGLVAVKPHGCVWSGSPREGFGQSVV